VHSGGAIGEYLRGDGECGSAAWAGLAMGVVCGSAVAAGIAYSERRIRFRAGSDFYARGLAEGTAAVCCGRADGVDGLLDAIGGVHGVFLPLHDGIVWTSWAGNGASGYGDCIWGAGGVQQLVVRAIPVWTNGMVVEGDDVPEVPVDADRREWDRGTSVAGGGGADRGE